MPEGDVAIAIILQTKVNLNLSITSDKQSYKEGDGAAVLQATFGDVQVEGATYVWDGTDAKDIGVVNPFADDESKQYFIPTNVGKEQSKSPLQSTERIQGFFEYYSRSRLYQIY